MPIIKPSQKQPAAMEVDITNTPTKKPWQGRDSLEERVRKLEEHTRKLEDQVRRNSKNLTSSNIAISKIREELDAESNEKKMDSLIITGIRPTKKSPNPQRPHW